MNKDILQQFFNGYVEAMVWSTSDTNVDGEELDSLEGFDLAPSCRAQHWADCERFLSENWDDIMAAPYPIDYAGHDLWLTRAGHGAGFWDGDLPEELGQRLTEAADRLGERDIYLGDDNLIYSI